MVKEDIGNSYYKYLYSKFNGLDIAISTSDYAESYSLADFEIESEDLSDESIREIQHLISDVMSSMMYKGLIKSYIKDGDTERKIAGLRGNIKFDETGIKFYNLRSYQLPIISLLDKSNEYHSYLQSFIEEFELNVSEGSKDEVLDNLHIEYCNGDYIENQLEEFLEVLMEDGILYCNDPINTAQVLGDVIEGIRYEFDTDEDDEIIISFNQFDIPYNSSKTIEHDDYIIKY